MSAPLTFHDLLRSMGHGPDASGVIWGRPQAARLQIVNFDPDRGASLVDVTALRIVKHENGTVRCIFVGDAEHLDHLPEGLR